MRILHLVLIGKWYDMIASGEKTEEYRALTPYWCNRLIGGFGLNRWKQDFNEMDFLKDRFPEVWLNSLEESLQFGQTKFYKAICFHRGYTNTTMSFEFESLYIDNGNEEWGAPKEPVFIIKLGKRL